MASQQDHNSEHSHHHIIPFAVLRNVCVALLFLTAATVIASRLHLGLFAAPVAFLIAFTKAMLVMMFFMGLKYDSRMNRMIFATGFIFLALLAFFCVLDIWTRINVPSTL